VCGGRVRFVDGYICPCGERSIHGGDVVGVLAVCSMPALQCRDGRRVVMASTKEQHLQAFARRAARVSKALWPTNVRHSIATGRAAQTRRRLIVKSGDGRWLSLFPARFRRLNEPGEEVPLTPASTMNEPGEALRPHSRGGGRADEGWGPLRSPSDLKSVGEREGAPPVPAQVEEPGRPQGAPPLVLSTPALTMNGVGATVLVGAGIVVLLAMRLWLLCLFFVIVLTVIFLLVTIRMRMTNVKHSMNSLQQGAERRSFPGVLGKAHFPNTPMPVEPPLVRVLETFDLSQTNVEHFLDLPEGGNTDGYSLESWKEAQMR
jgi:hypothetical protein